MNNEILFLYENIGHKNTLSLCREVLKSVLRKFRKSATITHRQVDFSESCRDEIRGILKEDVSRCNGVLFLSDGNFDETGFFNDCFNARSFQYFSGSHSIVFPATISEAKSVDGKIIKTSFTKNTDIEKAVFLALDHAKKKSKRIILCTDSNIKDDLFFYSEIENNLSGAREYDIVHYNFNELIYTFTKEIPAFDTIICPSDKASVIKMHINSLNRFPLSYNILHTDMCRIYEREVLPYEEFSNLSYASLLVASGNLIEKELGFKSAGAHLKKAVCLALKKCISADIIEFQDEVIRQINTPLRNRQVKANDSEN